MKDENTPLSGKAEQALRFRKSYSSANEMAITDQCAESFGQCEKITDAELEMMGFVLNHPKASAKVCQRIIGTLAHEGTEGALRVLKAFYPKVTGDLQVWAECAIQECSLFLSMAKGSEEGVVFYGGGLGGARNKMRCLFILMPLEGGIFSSEHEMVIADEFKFVANRMDCEVEHVECHGAYAEVIALIPMKVAAGDFVKNCIAQCNAPDEFVLEDYYGTNSHMPDQAELVGIMEVLRRGSCKQQMQ